MTARPAAWLTPAVVFAVAVLLVVLFVDDLAGRGVADARPLFERLPLLCAGAVAGAVLLPEPRARWRSVAIGLALTAVLPLNLARLGDVAWAPVAVGYAAVALVCATYCAIAACVVARAPDRWSACLLTAVACVAIHAAGPDTATFARGVVDARDVVYYAGCLGLFSLLARVLRRGGRRDPALALAMAVGVVAIHTSVRRNTGWRWDSTPGHRQTLSRATLRAIGGFRFDVHIHAYLSATTHPALARAGAQLRDVLAEYELVGGARLHVDVSDPGLGPQALRRFADRYAVAPFWVQLAGGRVIRVWFAVVVTSEFDRQQLDVLDLTTRRGSGGALDVQLLNAEYSITTALRNVSGGRHSLYELLAHTPAPVRLTLYASPGDPPRTLAGFGARLVAVGRRLAAAFPRRFSFARVRVTNPAVERTLLDWGIRPIAFGDKRAGYFHPVLRIGDGKPRLIVPEADTGSARIRQLIAAELRRAHRQRASIAVVGDGLDTLKHSLAASYRVTPVDLTSPLPAGVDVLLMRGAGLDRRAVHRADELLMRGGTLIVFVSQNRAATRGGLKLVAGDRAVRELVAGYGVRVDPGMVVDDDTAVRFRIPEVTAGAARANVYELSYPMFLSIPARQMAGNAPFGRDVDGVVMPWASALCVARGRVVLRSSPSAVVVDTMPALPDLHRFRATGFPPPRADARRGPFPLAAVVAGPLPSAFDPTRRSPATARLIVIGATDFVSDSALTSARQLAAKQRLTDNLAYVHAAIDWAVDGGVVIDIPERRPPPALTAPGWSWYAATFASLAVVVIALAGWRKLGLGSILRR